METLQQKINDEQTKRQREIDENNAVRGKIQDVISLYKEKEAVYRAQMQNQKENLKKIEESVRQQLDEQLSSTSGAAEE